MLFRIAAVTFCLISCAFAPTAIFAADDSAKPAAKEGDAKNEELKLPAFPADKTTKQSIQLDGKTINYDATVG